MSDNHQDNHAAVEQPVEFQAQLNPDIPFSPPPSQPQAELIDSLLLPKSKIRAIMKSHGILMITDDAVVELQQILNELLMDISIKSIPLTKHRNAKITNRSDIVLSLSR